VQVLATKHTSVHQSPKLVLRCPLVRSWVTIDILSTQNHLLFNKTLVVTPSLIRAHLSQHITPYTQQTNRFKHHKPKPLTKIILFPPTTNNNIVKRPLKTYFPFPAINVQTPKQNIQVQSDDHFHKLTCAH